MISILLFILKTLVSLGLFYLLYKLIFEHCAHFKFNRHYLLFSLIISFILPIIEVSYNSTLPAPPSIIFDINQQNIDIAKEVNNIIGNSGNSVTQETRNNLYRANINAGLQPINSFNIIIRGLIGVYVLGILFFLLLFIVQLKRTFYIIRYNTKSYVSNAWLIQHSLEFIPFSIFNYILINKSHYYENEYKYILLHEMEHINQKHSIDIIFVELLKIFFWINPFIWIYAKEIKQNHEYLADKGVIDHGIQPQEYQLTLLKNCLGVPRFNIVNNLNKSFIKKRIAMMSKHNSNQLSRWKLVLIAPVVVLLLYAFSKNTNNKGYNNFPLADEEITDFTKYIELNKPYAWASYLNGNLFCKGILTINKINEQGQFEGEQYNHTMVSKIPVTGILTKTKLEIYTAKPWNEIWSITKQENKKLRGQIFADYDLARKNSFVFYLAKDIKYNELLPEVAKNPSDKIVSGNIPLKLYEKYFWENYNDDGSQCLTGWYMITMYDEKTNEISGLQYNYRTRSETPFTGKLESNNITIKIGQPWNEVWQATVKGDMLAGTSTFNHQSEYFKGQGKRTWIMTTNNQPMLNAETVAELNTTLLNSAKYSGGETELHSFIQQNLSYPEKAKKEDIDGKVYVSFIVMADGSISDIKSERNVNPILDEAVIALVKLTNKKWIPAMVDNKPVASKYVLPIVVSTKD